MLACVMQVQRPRLELFQRIDVRVEQMVDRGLLQVRI